MAKPVNFYCDAPTAKVVYIAGDFNAWNPSALPMKRRVDGWWFAQVHLTHGHHQYRFVVDGKPVLDPRAAGVAHNAADGDASVIAVS